MILFYIIAGFVLLLVLFLHFYNNKKKRYSPYFKIKKKLEDDLIQANFSGDWHQRQKINLQLLWLETLAKVERHKMLRYENESNETSRLSKLSNEDIQFPLTWKLELDDLYFYQFAKEIILAIGDVLEKNDYHGFYKPDSILPVPKEFILKAIHFTFDYFNLEEPIYIIKDKDHYVKMMNTTKYYLEAFFIDAELPKSSIENFDIGTAFKVNHPYNEIEELQLIDWRTDADWQLKGYYYASKLDWDWAFACCDQAKKINSNSEQLKSLLSVIYMTKGEHHYNIGEKALAFESIKKSAELNYEEAIKWLDKH